jgi:hypothetical protein
LKGKAVNGTKFTDCRLCVVYALWRWLGAHF